MHHKGVLISVIILASVAVGGLLYMYGGPAFHPSFSGLQTKADTSGTNFTIIGQGQNAIGMDQQVNYRITDADQLATLWTMVYGTNGLAVPIVDFNKYEVLAVFDGSHSTGGYGVRVQSVEEVSGKRVLSITHTEPGSTCAPTNDPTSPFMIVQVEKSVLPLTHEESTETSRCQ